MSEATRALWDNPIPGQDVVKFRMCNPLTKEQESLIAMLRHQVKFGEYMQLSTDTVKTLLDAAQGAIGE